ncbi:hypothetical protein WICPIJ_003734 [Wickerhamomyces pijperi]|uniref:Histone-lysine N-methyltransferase, H3 lysine-36 specific n=2 Tax=Saccharomycotina TaxID=147537 RepID=A0A9P8Q8Z9_WICPI|nr:hypothetical protein WICPIJ_003734 [Wickerhamomyces pijperi]
MSSHDTSNYHSEQDSDNYNPDTTPTLELQFSKHDQTISDQHLEQTTTLKAKVPENIQLLSDWPNVTDQALQTFVNLTETTYQTKTIGASETSSEFMSCQCHPQYSDPELEQGNSACSDDECINRGTKIECYHEEGHRNYCGLNCQNQRFALQQYSKISIIKTERKGFGVRVDEELEADTFIYEYIGEVIDEKTFKKRMVEYDAEGLKHFYFMMLQRGEFIDATKKGSLGRFVNHSCDPNCYVEKWVVGEKLKMGIFSKRKILAGEELSFNYNVDRYGANSQPCYCGAKNCLGVIGGKTQTEALSLLPQVYSEALLSFGDESELQFVNEMNEQGRELVKNENGVNLEFLNRLVVRPIEIYQVSKVSAALLQCEDLAVLDKLVLRLEKSTKEILKKLYLTHGLESLKRLIKCYLRDSNDEWEALIIRILVILVDGPSVSKNYLEKTEMRTTIEDLAEQTSQYSAIHHKAEELLVKFDTFEERHVIKKRVEGDSTVRKPIFASFHSRNNQDHSSRDATPDSIGQKFDLAQLQKLQQLSTPHKEEQQQQQQQPATGRALVPSIDNHGLPKHWQMYVDYDKGCNFYYNASTQETQWERPSARQLQEEVKQKLSNELSHIKRKEEERRKYEEAQAQLKREEEKRKIQEIIMKAQQEEKERLEKEESDRKRKELKLKKKAQHLERQKLKKMKEKSSNSSTPSQSSTVTKDQHSKVWTHHFAKLITHVLKPYQTQITPSQFKAQARQLTKILTEKQYRRHPDLLTLPQSGSKDYKVSYDKIKGFVAEYMGKYLDGLKERSSQGKELEHDGDVSMDQE